MSCESIPRNGLGQFTQVDMIGVICPTCETTHEIYPSDFNRGRRFCSVSCASEAHLPRFNARNRVNLSCEFCGKDFESVVSDTDRKFCSNECRGKSMINLDRSEEQIFYASQEWKEVRTSVYKRDKYLCQICGCGKKGGKRVAHHLDGIRENKIDRINKDRIITLCIPCHNKVHGKFGGKI